MSVGDRNIAIIEYVYRELLGALETDQEIILVDRSLNDRQIWNYIRFKNGDLTEEQYKELREKYSALSKELIDFLVVTYADPLTSLKRDYNSSLALEERSFLNADNINEYNRSLKELEDLLKESVKDLILLDTSSISISDVSVEAASQIMPVMRKQYIKSFKQKYNIE